MRKPIIHCKNCKYFLKNTKHKGRVKKININPLMNELIASGREIIHDGVCVKSGANVDCNNKCKLWKYRVKEDNMTYRKLNFDDYECEGQISILKEEGRRK